MILNGVIAFICVISPNSIALQADHVIVVEDRPMMSHIVFQLHLAKNDSCSSRTVPFRH